MYTLQTSVREPWRLRDEAGPFARIHPSDGSRLNAMLDAANSAPALKDRVEKLEAALQALFDNCAMPHKHWGEGSNQKEADAAITTARELLETP